jgi:7-cyano-7-deazaguanine synthase in queuosine biosynthesis
LSEKKVINLLWTGGWDSTFRLLELCENDIMIQPFYFNDPNRKSRKFEYNAMKSILDAIRVSNKFKAIILDIKYIDVLEIFKTCANLKISEDFKYLREKYKIGNQYEWFALYCEKNSIELEAGVVHQYHGKVEDAIKEEGLIVPIKNDFLDGRRRVVPKGDNFKAFNVFGNLILPILDKTKEDEEKIAREKGWIEIMKLTWFCHSPIKGEPCGLCGPCDDAMNTGMKWRLPASAIRRYRYRKILNFYRRLRNRIIN